MNKYLIFKWGTSLMLFYDLPRFSEDLDFSLLNGFDKVEINNRLNRVINSLWFKIQDYENKKELSIWKKCYYNINWEQFELKLEISNRKFNTPIKYSKEILFVWNTNIEINLLDVSQNFSHKLCAFFDRNRSRDTVDIYYYLRNNSEIDEDILKERLKMNIQETLEYYIKVISDIENRKSYISEIKDLVNNDDILSSWYYLDITKKIIYNTTVNPFSINDLREIYNNIITTKEHLIQLNKSFYIIKKENWFLNYFSKENSIIWIINFSDNLLIYETDNIEELINFINENQLLFI